MNDELRPSTVSEATSGQRPSTGSGQRPSTGSGQRILIVDDDESTCRSLRLIFGKKGYETETAGTGREALEKAQERSFNLALLDIKLPDMAGIELIAPLKEMHPDMEVLMVTAYASTETAVQALNEGASAYINKPLNMDVVLATIREALEKQRLVWEKQRAEEKLRESEKKYRTLYETIRDGIAGGPMDGRIGECNQAFADMLGYSKDELRNLTYQQLTPERWHEMEAQIVEEQILKRGYSDEYEKEYIKKDGTIFPVSCKVWLRKDEKGAPVGMWGIVRDITERKRAAEALQESEERLRAIFESAKDAIFTKDLEGRYTRVNAACASLFGLTEDEIVGKTDFDLFPPQVARHTQEIDRAVMEKGEAISIEDTKPMAGIMRTFHVSKVPLRDARGNIVGLAGIARDITERVRMEEQLVYMATHDALTGLPNRRLFHDRLNLELAHAHRDQQKLAVMLLDLDHFKDVNDTLGHKTGDKLLQAVGDRLAGLLRRSDTVARMGGDEFMLICPEMAQGEDAVQVAQKILDAFRRRFVFDDHELHITTSIGIALYPDDGEDVDTLMRNADIAMYRAKDLGRDNVQRYSGIRARERGSKGAGE